ncbi:unnamed protein product [Lactuca saligna]|uniref:Uncharacterized protein n=1 Tax=Lactuca saligna TaxID=75948 RepID=A0AA35Y3I3_LACSI|nr:unnamed protein product [Lactuca saligna]
MIPFLGRERILLYLLLMEWGDSPMWDVLGCDQKRDYGLGPFNQTKWEEQDLKQGDHWCQKRCRKPMKNRGRSLKAIVISITLIPNIANIFKEEEEEEEEEEGTTTTAIVSPLSPQSIGSF